MKNKIDAHKNILSLIGNTPLIRLNRIVKDFKGNTIFIPGNHDWYSNGLKGLKRQEKYVTKTYGYGIM